MKQFKKILFATDFSTNAEYAFDVAVTLATKLRAKIIMVHVVPKPVDLRSFYVPHISFDHLQQQVKREATAAMNKFIDDNAENFDNFEIKILFGSPYEEIMKKADEEKVSLIVLGKHGHRETEHFFFGTTADRVVKMATQPVMVVRHPEIKQHEVLNALRNKLGK
ncbi:universal stress protein [Geothermobacter hydrogeniphilus]|uniref:Universal stress protein n=1 Tax=Geothermobacter hydrogeniphilus TaxID=1969733 RepID=A0A2K2H5E4_9BACT|nr:universal stress protein [Geothermobacter hydrogeniphilus]PNU18555.1 universal stress protein [Geothermobacter hydrogeniphilus]